MLQVVHVGVTRWAERFGVDPEVVRPVSFEENCDSEEGTDFELDIFEGARGVEFRSSSSSRLGFREEVDMNSSNESCPFCSFVSSVASSLAISNKSSKASKLPKLPAPSLFPPRLPLIEGDRDILASAAVEEEGLRVSRRS